MEFTTVDGQYNFRTATIKRSTKSPGEVKTCSFLANNHLQSPRQVVAGTYLFDGTAVFVDRANNQLLIADIEKETVLEIDLGPTLCDAKGNPIGEYLEGPTDVNIGLLHNELLVTFPSEVASLVVIYMLTDKTTLSMIRSVFVQCRSRSAVLLDSNHLVVTSPESVFVVGMDGVVRDSRHRMKRDRNGLMMVHRSSNRFFYGDLDDFVCCEWKNGMIREVFRFQHPQMRFPRGSVCDACGRILVCCDTSRNVFRVDANGKSGEMLINGAGKCYGDVDSFKGRREFFTTFWGKNEWPVIFRF